MPSMPKIKNFNTAKLFVCDRFVGWCLDELAGRRLTQLEAIAKTLSVDSESFDANTGFLNAKKDVGEQALESIAGQKVMTNQLKERLAALTVSVEKVKDDWQVFQHRFPLVARISQSYIPN